MPKANVKLFNDDTYDGLHEATVAVVSTLERPLCVSQVQTLGWLAYPLCLI